MSSAREPDRSHRVTSRMEPDPSDASLIEDSLTDPEAFAAIFDRHFAAISRFLRRRLAADSADELTAETFLVALRERTSFDTSRSSARPWLFGIASNLVGHHRRSEERRLRAYARLDRPYEPDFADEALARTDASTQRAEVAAALVDLNEGDRDALLLVAWGGLSYSEVADALAIPIGTVRSRVSRARRLLSPHLSELKDESEGVSSNG